MTAPDTTFRYVSPVALPAELVDSLNQTYFLHRLATEPEKVIPPGKTLISMMIHSQMNTEKTKQKQEEILLERVKEVAHRAFWIEAVESLSSPLPSVQLPRLKRLYIDLADAFSPLFPPGHRVIQSLKAHLPPTSSPLHSALGFLKELLLSLRERCAPIRDETVDQLYTKLDEWRDPDQHGQTHAESPASLLAVLIVDSIREMVSLAEYMKSDFNTAVIGSMSEQEVTGFVLQQAKIRERQLVLELWDAEQQPAGQALRDKWRSWVGPSANSTEGSFGPLATEKKWVIRLMGQLATNSQISCNLPLSVVQGNPQTSPAQVPCNEVPPHFFFVSPKLLYIQNYMQAITIAASLRSLTRLPVVPSKAHDFMSRIWSLLEMEIDGDVDGSRDGIEATKIVNLSDEVVRARRLVSGIGDIDVEEESRLREAVERTLRPQDPVFQLLHRRLTDALTRQLVEALESEHVLRPGGGIPETLKTGHTIGGTRIGKETRIAFLGDAYSRPALLAIKGFEDPTLASAIDSVLREIINCVTWVEMVWGDVDWWAAHPCCALEISSWIHLDLNMQLRPGTSSSIGVSFGS